jgi:hypothetical protein
MLLRLVVCSSLHYIPTALWLHSSLRLSSLSTTLNWIVCAALSTSLLLLHTTVVTSHLLYSDELNLKPTYCSNLQIDSLTDCANSRPTALAVAPYLLCYTNLNTRLLCAATELSWGALIRELYNFIGITSFGKVLVPALATAVFSVSGVVSGTM